MGKFNKRSCKCWSRKNPEELITKIKKLGKEVDLYLKKKGITNAKPFPGEKSIARELGKTSAYLNYKFLSLNVHSMASSSLRKVTKVNERTYKLRIQQIVDVGVAAEAEEWAINASVAVGKLHEIKKLEEHKTIGNCNHGSREGPQSTGTVFGTVS